MTRTGERERETEWKEREKPRESQETNCTCRGPIRGCRLVDQLCFFLVRSEHGHWAKTEPRQIYLPSQPIHPQNWNSTTLRHETGNTFSCQLPTRTSSHCRGLRIEPKFATGTPSLGDRQHFPQRIASHRPPDIRRWALLPGIAEVARRCRHGRPQS